MKIKSSLDGKLPLNKSIGISSMIISVKGIFLENSKYYPQIFIDEWL